MQTKHLIPLLICVVVLQLIIIWSGNSPMTSANNNDFPCTSTDSTLVCHIGLNTVQFHDVATDCYGLDNVEGEWYEFEQDSIMTMPNKNEMQQFKDASGFESVKCVVEISAYY